MIRVCYKTRRGAHVMAHLDEPEAANLIHRLARLRTYAIASFPDGGWFGEVRKIEGRWTYAHAIPQAAA
jgi:hypothetical protein